MVLLEEKLRLLPDKPGVYLMKDARGEVIYVGKARSLKSRVKSYFRGYSTGKTEVLVRRVQDIDYIVTETDLEALILELSLIKQHRPRYNVNLKDDKSYPFVKLTVGDEFPRLVLTRAVKDDGSRYFGPYTRVNSLKLALRLVRRRFPVRTCSDGVLRRGRPCLNAHLGLCLAPCLGRVSREEYFRAVSGLISFLEGKESGFVSDLKRRMMQAAARLDFEQAAVLRDQLRAVEDMLARQRIIVPKMEEADVLAVAGQGGEAVGQVFFVRGGRVTGREQFILSGTEGETPEHIMAGFITQYYARVEYIPSLILVSHWPEDGDLVEKWLADRRGKKLALVLPRRGSRRELVELALENARLSLAEREKREDGARKGLEELKQALGLARIPERIEVYDVSELRGTNKVGSMVVFEGGAFDRSSYRRFKVKSVAGQDDYASLREIVSRRFKRAREGSGESESGWARIPDLVIVDGGRGQLSAVLQAMRSEGFDQIPAFGLAKGNEYLFREGDLRPIILPRDSEGLRLVCRLRDEAHRFAVGYHRRLRENAYRSALEDIPGIGPRRRRELLRHFGSVEQIKKASIDEIASVPGMNRKVAEELAAALRGSPSR